MLEVHGAQVRARGVEEVSTPKSAPEPESAEEFDLNALFIHWMNHNDVRGRPQGCPAGCPFLYTTPGAALEARDQAVAEAARAAALRAYHITLDALGAPSDPWPCNRAKALKESVLNARREQDAETRREIAKKVCNGCRDRKSVV